MAQRLYEAVLKGVLFGQVCINRFNYYVSPSDGSLATSGQLANAMGFPVIAGDFGDGTVLKKLQEMVVSNYIFTSLFVRDVYSNTDFTERFADAVGAVATESNSPVLAFGFRTDIKNLAVHRGMKRFGGVAEALLAAGGNLTATGLAAAEALSVAMSAQISDPGADTPAVFHPCVVGKERYVVPGSDPVRYAYRYFPTVDEQFASLAIDVTWQNYDQVRTQGSRQYGRGI